MKSIALIISLLVISLLSCQTPELAPIIFVKPIVTNSQYDTTDIAKPFKARFVSEVQPIFAGKYKFQETIDINPLKRDTSYASDFAWGLSAIYKNQDLGKIPMNGFELVCDYEQTIKYEERIDDEVAIYEHFPVYFVNSTKTDKLFLAQEDYAFGIQEADGPVHPDNWRPIEGGGSQFCGTGSWWLVVHPNEFIVVLMRKYEGNYQTNMRVRFEVGENIMVSQSYRGSMDTRQFWIKSDSYLKYYLKNTDGKAANWLFYGAEPRREDWDY